MITVSYRRILRVSPIFRMSTHCALSFSLRPEGKTGSTTRLKVNKRNATNISAKMAVFFLPLYFRKSASSSMAHNCRRSSGILVFSLKPFPPRKKTNIQGRHGEFEPDKAHSNVVGIICPPDWDRVNCNPKFRQGLGLGGLSSRGTPENLVFLEIG